MAIAATAFGVVPGAIHAQRPVDPQTIVREWKTVGRHSAVVDSGGRKFVRLDEAPGMGMAWTPLDFTDKQGDGSG